MKREWFSKQLCVIDYIHADMPSQLLMQPLHHLMKEPRNRVLKAKDSDKTVTKPSQSI